jgi:Flp pilus assembly protein TadB
MLCRIRGSTFGRLDVEWMLLAGLGIMWAAYLVPWGRKKSTESRSVNEFEHRMELLANAEVHGTTGRWIVTPRKGVRFLGPDDRRRARARDRRRKLFVALIELIALSFLMGLVPPLRQVWYVTAGLVAVLVVYVWVLLSMKGRVTPVRQPGLPAHAMQPVATPSFSPAAREEIFDFEDESVHVVVREASVGV